MLGGPLPSGPTLVENSLAQLWTTASASLSSTMDYSSLFSSTSPSSSTPSVSKLRTLAQSSSSPADGCAVCGDKINGSRYGAPSCLGCIVFFRRAITKQSRFKCLKSDNCEITCASRCICRACRLAKCFVVGMNPMAIQRRDIMGPRKPRQQPPPPEPASSASLPCSPQDASSPSTSSMSPYNGMITGATPASSNGQEAPLIPRLLALQNRQRKNHKVYFTVGDEATMKPDKNIFDRIRENMHGSEMRRTRRYDVNSMIRYGLLDACEWAKAFEPFRRLDAHKYLLLDFAYAFMLIDQGYVTAQQDDPELWILQNNTFMSPDYLRGLPPEDVSHPMTNTKAKLHPYFVRDATENIGIPMRNMKIDAFECAVLKTIILFSFKNYFGTGQRDVIEKLQARCVSELFEHCTQKSDEDPAERFGAVLLLTANIRCTITTVYNQTRVSDLFGLMQFDELVKEVFLS